MATLPEMGEGRGAPGSGGECGLVGTVAAQSTGAGPGVRFAVNLQGCPLRCPDCPNPACRGDAGGHQIGAGGLFRQAANFAEYMRVSGGGLTVAGGEPLRQPAFVRDLLLRARDLGIHAVLDTAGFGNPFALKGLLHLADLVVVDATAWPLVRPPCPGATLGRLLPLVRAAVRLRIAVLPGVNDEPEDVARLVGFALDLPRLDRVEVVAWQGLPGAELLAGCAALPGLADAGPEDLRAVRNAFRARGLRAE